MKKLAALICLLPVLSYGAIEPVIIKLEEGGEPYTVPTNKVLVIEHVLHGPDLNGNLIRGGAWIKFISAGLTHTVYLGSGSSSDHHTVKVPAVTVITAHTDTATIFGLLVDSSDLVTWTPANATVEKKAPNLVQPTLHD